MSAIYVNKALNEKYVLAGINSLEKAWDMAEFVCYRNEWNLHMFCEDVIVKVDG